MVNKKSLAKTTMAIVLIAVAFFIGTNFQDITNAVLRLGAKPQENVQWVFECYEGTYVHESHNLITDVGEQLSRNHISGTRYEHL